MWGSHLWDEDEEGKRIEAGRERLVSRLNGDGVDVDGDWMT